MAEILTPQHMKTITFLMFLSMMFFFRFGSYAQDPFAKNAESNIKHHDFKQNEAVSGKSLPMNLKTAESQSNDIIIPEQRCKILIEQYFDIHTGEAQKELILEEIQLLLGYIPSDLRSVDPDQE